MSIPIGLIEILEKNASEIESFFLEFIKQVPLNYHPSSRGSVISIGFSEYSWTTLSSDLLEKQSSLVGKYRSWYNKSSKIIKKLLPDDFEEFRKYYKGKNPPRDFEIIDILQLNVDVWKSDKSDVIKKFQSKFSSQKNILLTLKHLESEAFDVQEVTKEERKGKISKRVFIIHGHNEEMKLSITRDLEKLGLEPIILHEQANEGKTIIEKFEKYSDVGFAISLLTPDDMGYSNRDGVKNIKPRARQNVILETGYFIGKLGRSKVVMLFKEIKDFEFPSDYHGIIYIPFDKTGTWRFKIIKEMKSQGYSLDANLLL